MDGDRKVGAVAGGLKLPACAELRNYKGTLEAFEGGARTQVVGQYPSLPENRRTAFLLEKTSVRRVALRLVPLP